MHRMCCTFICKRATNSKFSNRLVDWSPFIDSVIDTVCANDTHSDCHTSTYMIINNRTVLSIQ